MSLKQLVYSAVPPSGLTEDQKLVLQFGRCECLTPVDLSSSTYLTTPEDFFIWTAFYVYNQQTQP